MMAIITIGGKGVIGQNLVRDKETGHLHRAADRPDLVFKNGEIITEDPTGIQSNHFDRTIQKDPQKMNRTDQTYTELDRVLTASYQQAAAGKGKERHATEHEPFERQQICEIGRRLIGNKAAGPLFQAVKKIYESGRLPRDRAIAELYGAINYAAAAILILESEKD